MSDILLLDPLPQQQNEEVRQQVPAPLARVVARGKFLFAGDVKFWIKGVTYGTFAPDADGVQFPAPSRVLSDFSAMAAAGVNTVRVYTVPPTWLLDLAAASGLRVMVGLPWEQHIAFLDEPGLPARIEARLRKEIQGCAGHQAILCYAVGNEIPAGVVRYLGQKRVEAFLSRLAAMVRQVDPGVPVTYVNFPTTEYLDLPFVDFHTFNVYLEDRETLRKYLARLQNIAGEKPLVLAEIGLDSRRNGEEAQADVLAWQIASVFEAGCAGALVFSWTDEWYRGGLDILDWDFGLVARDRQPKSALAAVQSAYRNVPANPERWPRVSVVVCSYNGSATIGETLHWLSRVEYPDYEVIVVDDGSIDGTAEIAKAYDVRLISTPNNGLSHARNLGLHAATGEIVAYTDDDAYPDPDWLKFLAIAFLRSGHAAVGGPNLPPPEDNEMAQCVANAPGGPLHVLVGDELAEHIPGCNMAFRRDKLLAIGGFDPQFRVAGDDVDVCWRIQASGETIGFSPSAVIWHHRRPSFRRYLKQQHGYARAEALLARKWPEKYNVAGHMQWHGRLYGRGMQLPLISVRRLYQGQWGTAPFQSVYTVAQGRWGSLPLMPEWYGLMAALLAIGALGLSWLPLLAAAVAGLAGLGVSVAMAAKGARAAIFPAADGKLLRRMRRTTFALHLLQPVWRLMGRVRHGIGPWRSNGLRLRPVPFRRVRSFWSGRWHALEARLDRIMRYLRERNMAAELNGDFDAWDFTLRGSLSGGIRCLAMVEDHAAGVQHVRLRAWPIVAAPALWLTALLAGLALAAGYAGAVIAAIGLAVIAAALGLYTYSGCATAMAAWREAVAACAMDQEA